MKKLFALLVVVLVVPAQAPALVAPPEEEGNSCVEFFTDDVPFFFTETVPAGAKATWDGAKYHTTVAALAVATVATSAARGAKNVTVDTAVAVRDTVIRVTKPLLW